MQKCSKNSIIKSVENDNLGAENDNRINRAFYTDM